MKPFFIKIPELLGLGRQIGHINSRAFGVFSAEITAPILAQWVHCPWMFPLFNLKPLSLIPNIYIGIRIWTWAPKNYRFSLHVSVVCAIKYTYKLQIMVTKVKAFMQYKLLNKSKIFPTFIRYVQCTYCTQIFRYVFLRKLRSCCKINIAYVLISLVCFLL